MGSTVWLMWLGSSEAGDQELPLQEFRLHSPAKLCVLLGCFLISCVLQQRNSLVFIFLQCHRNKCKYIYKVPLKISLNNICVASGISPCIYLSNLFTHSSISISIPILRETDRQTKRQRGRVRQKQTQTETDNDTERRRRDSVDKDMRGKYPQQ